MDARVQCISTIAAVLASFDDHPLPPQPDHPLDMLRHDEVQMPLWVYRERAAKIVDALEKAGVQLGSVIA